MRTLNPISKMMISILGVVGEMERVQIKERRSTCEAPLRGFYLIRLCLALQLQSFNGFKGLPLLQSRFKSLVHTVHRHVCCSFYHINYSSQLSLRNASTTCFIKIARSATSRVH